MVKFKFIIMLFSALAFGRQSFGADNGASEINFDEIFKPITQIEAPYKYVVEIPIKFSNRDEKLLDDIAKGRITPELLMEFCDHDNDLGVSLVFSNHWGIQNVNIFLENKQLQTLLDIGVKDYGYNQKEIDIMLRLMALNLDSMSSDSTNCFNCTLLFDLYNLIQPSLEQLVPLKTILTERHQNTYLKAIDHIAFYLTIAEVINNIRVSYKGILKHKPEYSSTQKFKALYALIARHEDMPTLNFFCINFVNAMLELYGGFNDGSKFDEKALEDINYQEPIIRNYFEALNCAEDDKV